MDERDEKLLAALLEIAEIRTAVREVATEIRILRVMLVSAIAPALHDEEGILTRESHLRTEEMPHVQEKKLP